MWRIIKIDKNIEENLLNFLHLCHCDIKNSYTHNSKLKTCPCFLEFSKERKIKRTNKEFNNYINVKLKTNDELSYCAAGLFAVRTFIPKKSFTESRINLHPFAKAMIREIIKLNKNLFSFCRNPRYKGYKGKKVQVLMICEFRNGVWAYNFIGGKRDNCGENSLKCALREFKEEAGEFGVFSDSFRQNYTENKHLFGSNKVLYLDKSRYALYNYSLPHDAISFVSFVEKEEGNENRGCQLRWVSLSVLEKSVEPKVGEIKILKKE